MKKIIYIGVLLVLFSGCLNYFEDAEKTTKIEIQKEKVLVEINYKGKLTEKAEATEDCKTQIKKNIESYLAGLEANINVPDEEKRKIIKTKIDLFEEIKNSFECNLDKEQKKMQVSFWVSRQTVERASELMPKEGFILGDLNEEYFILKMRPETKEFIASEINKENLQIKVEGEIVEVKPKGFEIKNSFINFNEINEMDGNFIQIDFQKEKPSEFPFVLVAVSFIVIILLIVIIVAWKSRKAEEWFKKSPEEIKERMKQVLVNGLGTNEVEILSIEKNEKGYEAEAIIKTRKYNIIFNKKMELKEYIKI